MSPTQLVSVVGNTAVFSCSSLTHADHSIVSFEWMLNESLINETVIGSVTNFSEITHIGKLNLENLSVNFNGTRIQCVAIFDCGPPIESSEASTLLIQGMYAVSGQLRLVSKVA